MPFCRKCGNHLNNTAKFCNKCGAEIEEKKVEEKTEEPASHDHSSGAESYKCPYCGEILKSFTTLCPSCGYELRGMKSSASLRAFSSQLSNAKTMKEKIDLIRVFPVPNTKEDIFEFMILACSNFDASYYVSHLEQEDISDAWLSKIEQCHQKAGCIFPTDPLYGRVIDMYNGIQTKIRTTKAQPQKEQNTAVKFQSNESGGYASWSGFAKFCWIVLNIYMCGIPALIYYVMRNN